MGLQGQYRSKVQQLQWVVHCVMFPWVLGLEHLPARILFNTGLEIPSSGIGIMQNCIKFGNGVTPHLFKDVMITYKKTS
jgi:hypothetical protein